MYFNIFDSHAHYDDSRFDGDRESVLAQLPQKGVCGVMNSASDLKSSQAGLELSRKYPYIWFSAGVHPHEAQNAEGDYLIKLESLLKQPKCVALGEIGLDYYYDLSPRDVQRMVFKQQLELAVELNVPVVVHDREAHGETLELLRKYRPRGVVHCFSGSAEMASELVKLGMYIGFTGVVTFKNAKKPLEAAAVVPDDRLLIETDCPYMAPEPNRGKRCDSSMLIYTAQALAQARGAQPQHIFDITFRNAKNLYEI